MIRGSWYTFIYTLEIKPTIKNNNSPYWNCWLFLSLLKSCFFFRKKTYLIFNGLWTTPRVYIYTFCHLKIPTTWISSSPTALTRMGSPLQTLQTTLRQGYGEPLWSYFIGLFVAAVHSLHKNNTMHGMEMFVFFVFTDLFQKNNKKKQQQSGCEILFQRLMPILKWWWNDGQYDG